MNETNLGIHTHIDRAVREQIRAIVVSCAQSVRSIEALTGRGEDRSEV